MNPVLPDMAPPALWGILQSTECLRWKQRAMAALDPPIHASLPTISRLCQRYGPDQMATRRIRAIQSARPGSNWLNVIAKVFNAADTGEAGVAAVAQARKITLDKARAYLRRALKAGADLKYPVPRKARTK